MRKILLVLPVFFASTAYAEPPAWLERFANPPSAPRTQAPRQQTVPRVSIRPQEVSLPRAPKVEMVREALPETTLYPGNVIVVFRSSQQYAAYSNGKIAVVAGLQLRGPVSTGTNDKYRTPLTDPNKGPHSIEYKEIDYESSTYPEPDGGAPMPYAMFFDRKGGFALHEGPVPRWRGETYGVSHGCVRLLREHARVLFHHFSDKTVRVIVVADVAGFRRDWELRPESPF